MHLVSCMRVTPEVSCCEKIVAFVMLVIVVVRCKKLTLCVRLFAEIDRLEALDVFGMMKEASLKSLEEVFTDRKVDICYLFCHSLWS